MKRYIYTTLLVFATLFCQASGAQNETPQLLDTAICVKPGAAVHMSDFKPRIIELLQNREDSIWSECCDAVEVELVGNPQIAIDSKFHEVWPDERIDKNKEVSVTVNYRRTLTCSEIPLQKDSNMSDDSLALWYFFGRLLSETESEAVMTISDTAYITTLHKATFVYKFKLALPDSMPKIVGDSCFNNRGLISLSIGLSHDLYQLKWEVPGDIDVWNDIDTQSVVNLIDVNKYYLYPIVCIATACKGENRSDTVFIGNPTPKPVMADINCIASSENSFVAKVKDADSRLLYHWIFEESGSNREQQYSEGDSVTFALSPNMPGVLRLISTGGCRASDTVSRELHRSVMAGDIRLEGDTNCLFGGDSLSLVLQNAPQEHLVWRSKAGADTLLWNAGFAYRTNRTDTGVLAVSVFSKYCPEDTAVATFNIRKDLAVSIDPTESCISAYTAQTFKAIGNGINPEVHWYGNGVELDTMGYPTKDSVLLRLVNPGGQNLYVKVTAAECGKFSKDSIVLRPKPEKPLWDSLDGMFPPCIPLGMADTIELRVQPQEGVKFRWSILEEEITEFDSNSIPVSVNYKLSDRNAPIPVSVYANTDGCPNSDTLLETFRARGAGLESEWDLLQTPLEISLWGSTIIVGYNISFSDDGMEKDEDPFGGGYLYYWYSEDMNIDESNKDSYIYFIEEIETDSIQLSCKITSKEKQCYSAYTITLVNMAEQQDVLFATRQGEDVENGKGTEILQAQASFDDEDTPCPGIVLHPNPVRSGVQVRVEGICEAGSFTVECYSQQGRCLFRTSAKGDTFTIPTGSYAAGVYIIRIQPDGAATPIIKKLIII